MGTKGEKDSDDFAFGTITSSVIEECDCPVMAIPEGTKADIVIRKMTYATNFLKSDVVAIKTLVELASG